MLRICLAQSKHMKVSMVRDHLAFIAHTAVVHSNKVRMLSYKLFKFKTTNLLLVLYPLTITTPPIMRSTFIRQKQNNEACRNNKNQYQQENQQDKYIKILMLLQHLSNIQTIETIYYNNSNKNCDFV